MVLLDIYNWYENLIYYRTYLFINDNIKDYVLDGFGKYRLLPVSYHTIEITKDDIIKGNVGQNDTCALALAANRELGWNIILMDMSFEAIKFVKEFDLHGIHTAPRKVRVAVTNPGYSNILFKRYA